MESTTIITGQVIGVNSVVAYCPTIERAEVLTGMVTGFTRRGWAIISAPVADDNGTREVNAVVPVWLIEFEVA